MGHLAAILKHRAGYEIHSDIYMDARRAKESKGITLFKKMGGLPPEGVKLLGRWTKVDFSGGFDLLETEDPKKLIEFAYMWGDLMELNVFPVLEDQELSEALQKAMKKTRSAPR